MNTNKSKYAEVDFREYRKERDETLPESVARKQNRDERKRLARKIRHQERNEFRQLLRNGRLDEASEDMSR